MIFFTADLHFGHAKIIKYHQRPFADVYEMDKALIANWNSVVRNTDTIYCLGDFSFKARENYTEHLNGQIIFLKGDHDKWPKSNPDNYMMILKGLADCPRITLCHWCMRTWQKSHFNSWHLYGHSHGRLPAIGKSMDVGVDGNNYFPVSLDQLKKHMETRPDNPNKVKDRHAKS